MKDKYYEAVCALSEILLEQKSELRWKDNQLEDRAKEIEKLKQRIEYEDECRKKENL